MRTNVKRAGAAVAGTAAAVAYAGPVRRWMRTWGATPDELSKPLPGDEILPDATDQSTRAISIRAQPFDVWPHLQNVGDWRHFFDRLLARIPGARRTDDGGAIDVRRKPLREGDVIPTGLSEMRIVRIEPERAIVLRHTGFGYDYTWTAVIEPEGPASTRLVTRTRYKGVHALLVALDPLIFVGIRRWLAAMRRRAEADAASHATPSAGAGTRGAP